MKLRQLGLGLSSLLFPVPLQEAGRGEQAQGQSMAGEAVGALLACCATNQPPILVAAGRHIAKGTLLTLLLTPACFSLSCLADAFCSPPNRSELGREANYGCPTGC